jgi:hypothetical protein
MTSLGSGEGTYLLQGSSVSSSIQKQKSYKVTNRSLGSGEGTFLTNETAQFLFVAV